MFENMKAAIPRLILKMFTMSRVIQASLFLNATVLLGLVSQAVTSPLSATHLGVQCKTTPDSPEWPSQDAWNDLNEAVGGRLLQPSPPGAVCHPEQPTYDAGLCPAVQAGWLNYRWHSDDPVSTDWNNWNNDSCIPDPVYPCSGLYSSFSAFATCVWSTS